MYPAYIKRIFCSFSFDDQTNNSPRLLPHHQHSQRDGTVINIVGNKIKNEFDTLDALNAKNLPNDVSQQTVHPPPPLPTRCFVSDIRMRWLLQISD